MLYYFYTSIAGIALVVHLTINWRQLVDWRNAKSRPGALEFRYFLVSLVLFFVSDILWGIFAELKCPRLLYSDTLEKKRLLAWFAVRSASSCASYWRASISFRCISSRSSSTKKTCRRQQPKRLPIE